MFPLPLHTLTPSTFNLPKEYSQLLKRKRVDSDTDEDIFPASKRTALTSLHQNRVYPEFPQHNQVTASLVFVCVCVMYDQIMMLAWCVCMNGRVHFVVFSCVKFVIGFFVPSMSCLFIYVII